jgi:hypothetical protein
MTRIRLADGLSPAFVARQLHFLWMSGYFRHRCVNHVNQASIAAEPLSETVPVVLPPAAEQERIGDALDELLPDLDAGVVGLERVREKLKLYRASVLKAAVEGALTTEWRKQHPNAESARELLRRILADRRRRWEEDQLCKFKEKGQETPRNWKRKYREPAAPNIAYLPALPERWYFTTRPVIQAMCEVMQPTPSDIICDPAACTGGFLCNAYQYVLDRFEKDLDADEKRALREELVEGMELSPKVGRMCAMNVYLHGIGGDKIVVHTGHDSLAAPWGREYTMVLTNPPFGKKQSLLFVNEEGDTEKDDQIVVREDFWTSTSNKQLNFVQHIYSLLKIDGRAAMVVPDNVIFEGGAGEKVRRNLLQKCRVHTLLRLPTGIWYSPGVKANVIFFDKKEGRAEAWTDKLWVYDLRTNQHFTLKQKPILRSDFDEVLQTWSRARARGDLERGKP